MTDFQNRTMPSGKSRATALILCVLIGIFGVHRFYLGRWATGLLWIFTGGLFGIGTLIDLILIACGSFKDGDGRVVANW